MAQLQHVHRADAAERMAGGELKTTHLATHPMPLDEGPRI
jgi:hypothetical protein